MTPAATARADARARIVDVAARLLRQEGPGAVTTRGVAQGAGVQAPTIYRLFGDKDGLLEAVAEHVMDAFVSAKAAVVEAAEAQGVDALADLRAGWHSQVEFALANPELFRLLSDPGRVSASPAARRGQHVLEARVHRVAQTGRLRVSERRAVDLVQAAGTGLIQTLLSRAPAQRDPGLADELYDAVLHRVLTDPDTTEATATEPADGALAAALVVVRAAAPGLEALSEGERHLLAEWLDRTIDRR